MWSYSFQFVWNFPLLYFAILFAINHRLHISAVHTYARESRSYKTNRNFCLASLTYDTGNRIQLYWKVMVGLFCLVTSQPESKTKRERKQLSTTKDFHRIWYNIEVNHWPKWETVDCIWFSGSDFWFSPFK